jgi:hypothetical protein
VYITLRRALFPRENALFSLRKILKFRLIPKVILKLGGGHFVKKGAVLTFASNCQKNAFFCSGKVPKSNGVLMRNGGFPGVPPRSLLALKSREFCLGKASETPLFSTKGTHPPP